MKTFELPALPASCFGLAITGKFDFYSDGSEKILWIKDEKEETKDEEVVKSLHDTLHPVVSTAAPGSPERIEALREFVAGIKPEATLEEAESPFDITDEEISSRMVHLFVKLLKSEDESSLSPAKGKGERKRERRRVAE